MINVFRSVINCIATNDAKRSILTISTAAPAVAQSGVNREKRSGALRERR